MGMFNEHFLNKTFCRNNGWNHSASKRLLQVALHRKATSLALLLAEDQGQIVAQRT